MELKTKIEESLKQVIDPETSMDVMRMQLVKNLMADKNGAVTLIFSPSSPTCPLAFQLALSIQEAVKKVEGVTGIKIFVESYVRAEELENILAEND
jgi:metal-sulfur cluster biosynthetic enzyme